MREESKVRKNGIEKPSSALASNRRSLWRTDRVDLFRQLPLLAVFTLFVSACPLYNPAAFIQHNAVPDDILSAATQITLKWDPPPSPVVSYTLSYRLHGTTTWIPLATIPSSPQPTYTVLHSVVGNGTFDFAVSATDSNGVTSPLHTSLDPTADPNSGWYLSWGQ